MANTLPSPFMHLPIPVQGVDPGPDYALNVNACLTFIDQHTHNTGSGQQVQPTGLNINSDLTFQGNNAIALRSVRFLSQVSPITATSPDLDCVYVSGVDLYYNDGSGNQVRMTNGGNVAGSTGSISGLSNPASASYAGGTFTWQQGASTSANMDCGSVIFRNNTASSNGVTVNAPNSLAANYALQWPTGLPGAQSFVTLDNSGNFAAPIAYSAGITGANIAAATVARTNMVAVGQQISSSSGSFFTSSTTYVNVTNLTATITTSGRPVMVMVQSDGNGTNPAYIGVAGTSTGTVVAAFQLKRGSTVISQTFLETASASSGSPLTVVPPGALNFLDTPTAGTYTYTVQAKSPGNQVDFVDCVLVAYEL